MSEAESDVRIRRAELGLGQAELARLVGVAPSYVWKIEHGTRVPSVEVLPKLAKALEVPEAFFAPLFVGLLWRTRPGFRVALPALRDERIRLELQQQEVANRAGVSP